VEEARNGFSFHLSKEEEEEGGEEEEEGEEEINTGQSRDQEKRDEEGEEEDSNGYVVVGKPYDGGKTFAKLFNTAVREGTGGDGGGGVAIGPGYRELFKDVDTPCLPSPPQPPTLTRLPTFADRLKKGGRRFSLNPYEDADVGKQEGEERFEVNRGLSHEQYESEQARRAYDKLRVHIATPLNRPPIESTMTSSVSTVVPWDEKEEEEEEEEEGDWIRQKFDWGAEEKEEEARALALERQKVEAGEQAAANEHKQRQERRRKMSQERDRGMSEVSAMQGKVASVPSAVIGGKRALQNSMLGRPRGVRPEAGYADNVDMQEAGNSYYARAGGHDYDEEDEKDDLMTLLQQPSVSERKMHSSVERKPRRSMTNPDVDRRPRGSIETGDFERLRRSSTDSRRDRQTSLKVVDNATRYGMEERRPPDSERKRRSSGADQELQRGHRGSAHSRQQSRRQDESDRLEKELALLDDRLSQKLDSMAVESARHRPAASAARLRTPTASRTRDGKGPASDPRERRRRGSEPVRMRKHPPAALPLPVPVSRYGRDPLAEADAHQRSRWDSKDDDFNAYRYGDRNWQRASEVTAREAAAEQDLARRAEAPDSRKWEQVRTRHSSPGW
jgi:hypothetical protein